jgi:hypothetical protein
MDQSTDNTTRGGLRPRRLTFVAAVAAGLVAAASAGAVALTTHGDSAATTIVTGSTCPGEARLIKAALDDDWQRADVDGDGRLDRVAAATDQAAGPACRAFVGVRTADGTTYSTALDRTAVPPRRMAAEVIGLPDLGMDVRAEIVVDTHRLADSALSQLFTLTNTGLVRVHAPAFEDGTLVVAGGGVTYPRGAGCTSHGALVLSMALLDRGRYEVSRAVYPVVNPPNGGPLRLTSPRVTSAHVPANRLVDRFWEFASPHFARCGGELDAGK